MKKTRKTHRQIIFEKSELKRKKHSFFIWANKSYKFAKMILEAHERLSGKAIICAPSRSKSIIFERNSIKDKVWINECLNIPHLDNQKLEINAQKPTERDLYYSCLEQMKTLNK